MNDALVYVFAAFIIFGLGLASGCEGGRGMVRRAAIEHGVAEWTVDPRTGATKFEWKGSK